MKKLMLMFPIISGGLWGSAGIFVRKLSYFGVNSYTIISSRVLIALIILFIGILLFDKSLLKIKRCMDFHSKWCFRHARFKFLL